MSYRSKIKICGIKSAAEARAVLACNSVFCANLARADEVKNLPQPGGESSIKNSNFCGENFGRNFNLDAENATRNFNSDSQNLAQNFTLNFTIFTIQSVNPNANLRVNFSAIFYDNWRCRVVSQRSESSTAAHLCVNLNATKCSGMRCGDAQISARFLFGDIIRVCAATKVTISFGNAADIVTNAKGRQRFYR